MPATPPLPVDLSGIRLDPGAGLSRQLYQALRERLDEATPADIIEEVIKSMGYRDYILDGTPQAEDREETSARYCPMRRTLRRSLIFLKK